jgi:hypothetical protein
MLTGNGRVIEHEICALVTTDGDAGRIKRVLLTLPILFML